MQESSRVQWFKGSKRSSFGDTQSNNPEYLIFFAKQLGFELTQKLGSHPNVGGNLFLGQALYKAGVLFAKIKVSRLCIHAYLINQTFVTAGHGFFRNDAKKPFEFRNFF
jgi:hypothetical protein